MAGSSMSFSYDEGVSGSGFRSRVMRVICDWVSDDATGAGSAPHAVCAADVASQPTDQRSPDLARPECLLVPCQTAVLKVSGRLDLTRWNWPSGFGKLDLVDLAKESSRPKS